MPDDIDPIVDTCTDDGIVRSRPQNQVVNGQVAHLLSSRVESYLNGWTSPLLRAAIREALKELGRDPHAAKHSRTENGLALAKHLRRLSQMLDSVAAGVQERTSQETHAYVPPRGASSTAQ